MTTFESDAALGGIIDTTIDPDKRRAAQLAVCANSADSAEALETLRMLGLIGDTALPTRPEPDGHCRQCNEPCVDISGGRGIPVGMRAFAKKGWCRSCYRGIGVSRA